MRVATLQHPTVTCRLTRVEQAREKAIERDLAPQAMEINGVATRPFEITASVQTSESLLKRR